MLIRVRGGNAGVFRYLRDGMKSGRKYTRAELDERVVLAGNMGLAESIVNAMSSRGEKYLHITLSFKEDQLPLETLQAITDEFQNFCMSAFRPDEYSFYAEAHLPRIKSYTNKRTGQEIIRKPHIHIVIPEMNLLTQKGLNPLGRVDQQTKFLEAFQENINNRFGLASPKDNRRVRFTDESTLLSRQKGDDFNGIGGELKRQILDAMLQRGIEDFPAFEKLVAEFGATRLRNPGKGNAYINVRPDGSAKGVNLKDFVFSPSFVTLPMTEKKSFLAAEAQRRAAEVAEYVSPHSARPSPAEITDRLEEWHEIRARELKLINSGSRKVYAAYKAADRSGKKAILDEREAAFYKKHDQSTDADLRDVLLDALSIDQAGDPAPGGEPDALPNREPESVIEQLLVEHKKGVSEAALSTSTRHAEIKLKLDAHRLLARLSHTHGVVPEKYPVRKGEDGGDRIQCGRRKLNVADFLTKELHLPWPDAQTILLDTYAAQKAGSTQRLRPETRSHFWEAYRQTWPARRGQKEKDWVAQKASEATRRAAIKSEYLQQRSAIKSDPDKSPADRKAAYSLLAMWRAIESKKLVEQIRKEREALRARHQPPSNEGYRAFLVVLAHDRNSAALAELRRQFRTSMVHPTMGAFFTGDERDLKTPVILPSVSYRVNTTGIVTYYTDIEKTKPILRDWGREVQVFDHSHEAVEIGLRLALQKFGPELNVAGSEQFKREVLAVVLKTGLPVRFWDPVMAGALAQLTAQRAQAEQSPDAGVTRERLSLDERELDGRHIETHDNPGQRRGGPRMQ